MEQRIKLTVAYLGTPFHGWQRQPGQRTVQGEIERAVAHVTKGLRPVLVGAGRTDAGVHARGQVAHLDLPVSIPIESLRRALNAVLPETVRIMAAARASAGFHALGSARGKHYVYRIAWGPTRLPWAALRSASLAPPRDREAFEAGLRCFEGRHDMASFSSPAALQGPTEKTLFRTAVHWGPRDLAIHFVGSGFLRYQVRRMVGALLEVGSGERTLDDLARLLAQPTPGAPVRTAPARGLTLEKVYYRSVVDSSALG